MDISGLDCLVRLLKAKKVSSVLPVMEFLMQQENELSFPEKWKQVSQRHLLLLLLAF